MERVKKKKKIKTRAEPTVSWLCSPDAYDVLTCGGYTSLADNPEIAAGVDAMARLIGSMTVYLMQNSDGGDIRVINGLSRKIDIDPNDTMTRSMLVQWIVRTLFLNDGNALVLPITQNGLLEQLQPVPPSMAALVPAGMGYVVQIDGKTYEPRDVLHFRIGGDMLYPWKGGGYRVQLKSVADNLKQAAATEKGFMSTKWKPSIIVKVDALTEEFASKSGRKRLLDEYIDTNNAGEPWIIPSEQFSVEQVRPLSLSDLAISDVVTLDKKTVAAILGVPPYVLGVGDFSREEWNNFIAARLMPLAQMIEQELTKKLLYDPSLFFRFNVRSLYNYSLDEVINAGSAMVDRMAMTRNEWRAWVGLAPRDDMDELLALENYIPADRLGDQKKLTGG